MKRVNRIADVRQQVSQWKRDGMRVAFVPTMGNLHEGHLTLVRRARQLADKVVASIFVNPTQFVQGEDFDAYPRTPEEDAQGLAGEGCDLLFLPEEAELYPHGREQVTWVETIPALTDILCGASRPGHFRGVTTVVSKLFNVVQPDVALFGEKDYQQLAVLRRMVADLDMPVEMVGVATVREPDGLAKSSRNGYLTAGERAIAPALYRTLQWVAEQLKQGRSDFSAIEYEGNQQLEKAGLRPDYLSIRQPDLAEAVVGTTEYVVLAAAYLGRARLIDNLQVSVI